LTPRTGARPRRGEGRQPVAQQRKTIFTPHVDTGDFVIVINAENPAHRKKEEQKSYMSFPVTWADANLGVPPPRSPS
jgi:hypothetical protein